MNSRVFPLSELLAQHAFPEYSALAPSPGNPIHVAGLAGSAASALIASQFQKSNDSILYLAPDVKDAETVAEDLLSWLPEEQILHFPGLDLKPYEWREPFGQVRERRLEVFEALYRKRRVVLICTITAFLERLTSPRSLHQEIVEFKSGDALNPTAFREAALMLGFREESAVQELGDFSVRGEILDIYPYLAENPYRIVLFGDTIESIKEFDIFTQRSLREISSVALFPQDECCYPSVDLEQGLEKNLDRLGSEDAWTAEHLRLVGKRDLTGIHWQKAFFKKLDHSLLDFLGVDTRVIAGDSEGITKAVAKTWEAAREGYNSARSHERFVNTPEELFLTAAELEARLKVHRLIQLSRLSWEGSGSHTFDVTAQQRSGSGLTEVESFLRKLTTEGLQVRLLCPNEGQAERLRRLTEHLALNGIGHVIPVCAAAAARAADAGLQQRFQVDGGSQQFVIAAGAEIQRLRQPQKIHFGVGQALIVGKAQIDLGAQERGKERVKQAVVEFDHCGIAIDLFRHDLELGFAGLFQIGFELGAFGGVIEHGSCHANQRL